VGGELGRHTVEQRVLLPLQLDDRLGERVAVAGQRVGVPARVAGLDVTERRFRHQGAKTGVLGFVLEERELLLRDRQLGAKALEALAHVHQTPLEDGLRHGTSILRRAGAAIRSPNSLFVGAVASSGSAAPVGKAAVAAAKMAV
jgi:hypothetical protein